MVFAVSLFTREWIEISSCVIFCCTASVSLFTREWIEIFRLKGTIEPPLWSLPLYEGVDWNVFKISCKALTVASPSLRGSGLKWNLKFSGILCHCLPLYERVDWNVLPAIVRDICKKSPSLRGSGLKFRHNDCTILECGLPLYEGVDWNHFCPYWLPASSRVSLFTREWIEIALFKASWYSVLASPSLRGSGLKSFVLFLPQNGQTVSLFTREWIEITYAWLI